MKISVLFNSGLLFPLLIGCSTKEQSEQQFNGHWHSTTQEAGTYRTLDITDSLTTADKYDISGLRFEPFDRKDKTTNEDLLPFQEYDLVHNYWIDNDTLKILKNSFAYTYVKSNLNKCELPDRYSRFVIDLALPNDETALDYDEISFSINLIIGSTIKSEFKKSVKVFHDPAFIQADDEFIDVNEIPRLCEQKKSMFVKGDSAKLVLHIDKSVNEEFVNRIIKQIPSDFFLYKAVNKAGHLGVREVRRGKSSG